MSYMDSRFMGMEAYNPQIPYALFQDGSPTLLFTYDRRHLSTLIDSTWERVGVVVAYQNKTISVYTDEASHLFGDKSSNICIGKLLTTRAQHWNGMATLDIRSIQKYYPFAIA